MNTLGIILARKGSKRCPGKNTRPLSGIPLIMWSIVCAKRSDLPYLVVSTDDEKIWEMCKNTDTAFINRPEHLSTDTATSYSAIIHAYSEINAGFSHICLLQPTSPFRTPWDINACLNMMSVSGNPGVVSCEFGKDTPNGAVYVGRTDWLLDGGNWDLAPTTKYYMTHEASLDIDTEDDFAKAEQIATMLTCGTKH